MQPDKPAQPGQRILSELEMLLCPRQPFFSQYLKRYKTTPTVTIQSTTKQEQEQELLVHINPPTRSPRL